ncbi:DUF2249 domain-containing protein [Fodinibius sediminis]|uniref:Uncharacterized conserved protein, DUF2249 family n=1 Tax=Fodinibius sediminis TaxID=1214077 RepID=A0A521BM21_9BACT|nr:DUF2249 domain-containing protein [Fodinibius sediminis]SMO47831.1 Uncharacterized conserved protein, DUF2249 family [Fodinibius sediminis]
MPATIEEIDVRNISPHEKHATVFDEYDKLRVGETFIIINDHDPKPLGYQLAVMHGEDNLSWKYLEKGPKVWKVLIGKTAK